jgi:hypothetical protein
MVGRMVPLALDHLASTRLASGLYCFDVGYSNRSAPRGESVRYSLMSLLGLQRAAAAGLDVPDLDALWQSCLAHQSDFAPGDFGLALWADRRRDGAATPELLKALEQAAPDQDALAPLVGMEIGWLVVGLAEVVAAGESGADELLERVTAQLESRRAPTGMYRHHGAGGARGRLPNFATEIYSLLALATLGRLGLDPDVRGRAVVLADHLLRLQLPDGGWPWLFDADRATVVERYEIYSVHQDAMAPMALIEMTELTGDRRYLDAAVRGLGWSHGDNELGVDLFDDETRFAHRSIRRRRPWDRLAIAANCLGSVTAGRALLRTSPVELNETCRPYHLGWILEAWAGRQHLVESGEPS